MDYFPATLYQKQIQFWPLIDDKLRQGKHHDRHPEINYFGIIPTIQALDKLSSQFWQIFAT